MKETKITFHEKIVVAVVVAAFIVLFCKVLFF